MKIVVKPITVDVTLFASYKESILRLVEDVDSRISLVGKLQKLFGLRLDDIKFNRETLSGNYAHFLRGYDRTLFDVSIGLEEATSKILRADSEEQILDLYGRLFQILDEIPISLLRVSIGHQLAGEADSEAFLASLNPNCPAGFQDMLKGRGVQYNLQVPQHNLEIFVILASSLFHKGGIFLNIDSQFSPYSYDFQTAAKIIIEYYTLSLTELGLDIQREG